MVYVFLADGFEELEAIAPVDLLRRAGVRVNTISLSNPVVGSLNIAVHCDSSRMDMDACTGVILPGGPGHVVLAQSNLVHRCLAAVSEKGGMLAAICAAPSILGKLGYLKGKRATCYPGFEDKLTGATVVDESVVIDGNVITARAAGSSIAFGLACVEYLCGTEVANKIAAKICYDR